MEWILSGISDHYLCILYIFNSTEVREKNKGTREFFSWFSSLPQNRLQITATLLLTSITFRWTVNRSLVSLFSFLKFLDFLLSFLFQPTISYLTALDKYAIISIFILIILCVWHAIIGAIVFIETHESSLTTDNVYVWIDRYLFFTFCALYTLMHICMIIWYYQVPCGCRRKMEEKDMDYRQQLKNQRHSNGYLVRLNSKERFSLFNVMIKDEMNKDRIGHF